MSKKIQRIQVIETISPESYTHFSLEMSRAENAKKNIIIELYSAGGEAVAALAYAARIRRSRSHVTVRVYGEAASAAVLVLASGHHRQITAEAWVMVHEDSGKLKGSISDMERDTAVFRRLENQWNELLARYTRTSAQDWARMHKETTYLNAEQVVELGLADEIV